MNAPIKHICIENPTPLKIVGLPKYSQVVQPYEYGHPKLEPTEMIEKYTPYLPSNTGGKKRGQKFMYKNISKKDKSKTFKGIASAMAQQWGIILNK